MHIACEIHALELELKEQQWTRATRWMLISPRVRTSRFIIPTRESGKKNRDKWIILRRWTTHCSKLRMNDLINLNRRVEEFHRGEKRNEPQATLALFLILWFTFVLSTRTDKSQWAWNNGCWVYFYSNICSNVQVFLFQWKTRGPKKKKKKQEEIDEVAHALSQTRYKTSVSRLCCYSRD